MLRPLSFALASALALSMAAPAFAQRDRVRLVHIGDVDTHSARGADIAIERIEDAAKAACGAQGGAQPIPQRVSSRECTIETTEIAINNSNNTGLIARYYGRDPEVVIEEEAAPYPEEDGTN